jgi:hypothetical protein
MPGDLALSTVLPLPVRAEFSLLSSHQQHRSLALRGAYALAMAEIPYSIKRRWKLLRTELFSSDEPAVVCRFRLRKSHTNMVFLSAGIDIYFV